MRRLICFSLTLLVGLAPMGIGERIVRAEPRPEASPEASQADLVILNCRIWSAGGTPDDAERPAGTVGIAVVGGVIDALAPDEVVRRRVGPATMAIDAGGRRVVPGLTDSHVHLIGGGLQLVRLNLREARDREEFVRATETYAGTRRDGEWILGGRWSTESWAKPETPERAWIDVVTGDHPALLQRMDGHSALANSTALRLAGIDANGPADPDGGEIVRDPKTREPTGILRDAAIDLVERLIPAPSTDERYEALRRAMKLANSLGLTAVHDMSELPDLEVYRRASADRALTLRITSYLSVAKWDDYFDLVAKFPVSDDFLRIAGFKGYMDGSMGSRTAFMHDPYEDTHGHPHPRGLLAGMANPVELLKHEVDAASQRGFQIALHAIGDEANHIALDLLESNGGLGGRQIRHRVEHAQHLLSQDIGRFGRSGVIASMQPLHKADDGRYVESVIGRTRLEGAYAFRQLVDTGALVCFGSDWPVVSMSPFEGIHAAVTARTLDGKVWLSEHSLTVAESLRAYSQAPAIAVGRADRGGTIELGRLADLVILDDDPLTISPERLKEVRVWRTIVNGRVVFAAGN